MKINVGYYFSKLTNKLLNLPSIKNSKIHKTSKVCSGSNIINTNMEEYSYIGNNCTVVNTNIGSFCSIADDCKIGLAMHPIEWVSTSPVFHDGYNVLRKNFSNHTFNPFNTTSIGCDVWIGANCLVKSGVKIGNGAIVGMGSVVTKDVDPYTIVAGNPAKIIRMRFPEDMAHYLERIKWWELKEEEIQILAKDFNDIDSFLRSKEIV